MPAEVSIIGQQFGKWKVIAEAPTRFEKRRCVCLCGCGTQKVIQRACLLRGETKSCGCRRIETRKTHGHSVAGKCSKAYATWKSMMQRCRNPNNVAFKDYGGRGITVCERWHDFKNFFADMGDRPDQMTIERCDNDGNYEPGNCIWASRKQQANNRRNNRIVTLPPE